MSADAKAVIDNLRGLSDCLAAEDYARAVAYVREAEACLHAAHIGPEDKEEIAHTLRAAMHEAEVRREDIQGQLNANHQTRSAVRRYGRGFTAGHRAYGDR